jgi:hypothetical protein
MLLKMTLDANSSSVIYDLNRLVINLIIPHFLLSVRPPSQESKGLGEGICQ